jgi:hypothetical protein
VFHDGEGGVEPAGGQIIGDCGDVITICDYSVDLIDSSGDGWNGGALTVEVDGVVALDAITLLGGAGPETYYFEVATDAVIDFIYTPGDWAYENEYIVYNSTGAVVFHDGAAGTEPVGGQIIGNCDAAEGLLAGVVTDENGLPLQGVTVNADQMKASTTTNDLGEYEITLAPGFYTVEFSLNGYQSEIFDDIEILEAETTTLDAVLLPLPGGNCDNPIIVDTFPYEDLGQTNCGMGNDQSNTCLGSYDGGEDIHYQFTLTSESYVTITMDPKGTTWTGMLLSDQCPAETCIAFVTGSAATPRVIEELLAPGTYYIMIDTWPSPFCIPDFDLTITALGIGQLSGIVTDEDGNLLEGVAVFAGLSDDETFTDENGYYEFTLFEGFWDVGFSLLGYFDQGFTDVLVEGGLTTTLDVVMETVPAPECAQPVYPFNGSSNIPPDAVFEWMPQGANLPMGYEIILLNETTGVFVEGFVDPITFEISGTDLGNVTTYTPAELLEWGCHYLWMIRPYNLSGYASDGFCALFSFNVSNLGEITGFVTSSLTGDPMEGVEIFIEQVLPLNRDYTTTIYTDATGGYSHVWEAGTYNFTFSNFSYETAVFNNVPVPATGTTLDVQMDILADAYGLPFAENWNDGSFATQKWTAQGNWDIVTFAGNPAPTARFNWSPSVTNYELLLQSYPLNAMGYDNVFVQFDYFLSNYSLNTVEELSLVVFDGYDWHVVATYNNQGGSIPWTTANFDISGFAAGKIFTIGFMASGANSYNINQWYVDNIYVSGQALQKIKIPTANNWGYISSYLELGSKMMLEDAMADILDDMVIMISDNGFFWPGQNINTIGHWNTYKGYKIKMSGNTVLVYTGTPVEDKTVTFAAGTHIIPVLSDQPIDAQSFLANYDVAFVFDLNGGIYWPDGGVFSLNQLVPGYGYLAKFNSETTLDFSNTKASSTPSTLVEFENTTPWNDTYKTGDVHIVGISAEAIGALQQGDIIGVFNLDGLCTGMAIYAGKNEPFAVAVYGSDMTTGERDGMEVSEPLTMKVFRNNDVIEINPGYSTLMPNYDGLFAVNGLSMITDLKLGATGIATEQAQSLRIYPNPSNGLFTIDGISESFSVVVMNSHGQIVFSADRIISNKLDLTGQPTGVYFVKLIANDQIKTQKVIVQ